MINHIKDNNNVIDELSLYSEDADRFTDLAWRLLGRYIANNTHMKEVFLNSCNLTDEEMSLLFKELVKSVSLERLDIDDNRFGIDGVRSMVPLLQNSPHLSTLMMGGNRNINSECFGALLSALDGHPSVEKLFFINSNVTDISALESYNLPNLRELVLNHNNVGRDGCSILSNMVQKDGSTLTELFLINNGIDDEGAEMIASSIKQNPTFTKLHLGSNNGITEEKGCKAFLKLLMDVSSIENTYTSNHTLAECTLIGSYNNRPNEIQQLIKDACEMNRMNSNPGRAKVIKYQLNSQNRKKLCKLQGIEYSTNNIFADIEPVLLPRILALIGDRHGQSELYTALIPTAPDLLSYIDRRSMLNDVMAKNTARASSLSEEYKEKVAEYEKKMAI